MTICRGVSTSVERRQAGQNGRVGAEDRRQETEERRRNPDLVGMGVLIVGSFSISRILYLLDVYYIRWEVGCQVNSSLTTDYTDYADYTDLGIRVYKCMRIYLWGAI